MHWNKKDYLNFVQFIQPEANDQDGGRNKQYKLLLEEMLELVTAWKFKDKPDYHSL